MKLLKLSILSSVLLAGCEQPLEPAIDVDVTHLSKDDKLKITIEYNGDGKPVAEVNGEEYPVPQ